MVATVAEPISSTKSDSRKATVKLAKFLDFLRRGDGGGDSSPSRPNLLLYGLTACLSATETVRGKAGKTPPTIAGTSYQFCDIRVREGQRKVVYRRCRHQTGILPTKELFFPHNKRSIIVNVLPSRPCHRHPHSRDCSATQLQIDHRKTHTRAQTKTVSQHLNLVARNPVLHVPNLIHFDCDCCFFFCYVWGVHSTSAAAHLHQRQKHTRFSYIFSQGFVRSFSY